MDLFKKLIPTVWGRTVLICGGLLTILGVMDKANNLGIFKFAKNLIITLYFYIINHRSIIIILAIFVWLAFLTLFIRKINGNNLKPFNNRLNELGEDLKSVRQNIMSENRKTQEKYNEMLKRIAKLEEDGYEVMREAIKVQIDRYERNDQEGAILCRIDLLELDFKEGYEFRVHETLADIADFLTRRSIFSESASKLKEEVSKLPAKYDPIVSKINGLIKIH